MKIKPVYNPNPSDSQPFMSYTYICDVCNSIYTVEDDAKKCERTPIVNKAPSTPAKIGDIVQITFNAEQHLAILKSNDTINAKHEVEFTVDILCNRNDIHVTDQGIITDQSSFMTVLLEFTANTYKLFDLDECRTPQLYYKVRDIMATKILRETYHKLFSKSI